MYRGCVALNKRHLIFYIGYLYFSFLPVIFLFVIVQFDTTFNTDYIRMHVKDSRGKCYIYFINYIYYVIRTGKIAVIYRRILYD